jgi:hypothetical protein
MATTKCKGIACVVLDTRKVIGRAVRPRTHFSAQQRDVLASVVGSQSLGTAAYGKRFRLQAAISGPSALSPDFLQSGHASSSINGQPYSGAKGEPLREVAQI